MKRLMEKLLGITFLLRMFVFNRLTSCFYCVGHLCCFCSCSFYVFFLLLFCALRCEDGLCMYIITRQIPTDSCKSELTFQVRSALWSKTRCTHLSLCTTTTSEQHVQSISASHSAFRQTRPTTTTKRFLFTLSTHTALLRSPSCDRRPTTLNKPSVR